MLRSLSPLSSWTDRIWTNRKWLAFPAPVRGLSVSELYLTQRRGIPYVPFCLSHLRAKRQNFCHWMEIVKITVPIHSPLKGSSLILRLWNIFPPPYYSRRVPERPQWTADKRAKKEMPWRDALMGSPSQEEREKQPLWRSWKPPAPTVTADTKHSK